MKERVLITGGAGYLGSVLTRRLLDEGYSVTCLDNFEHKEPTHLGFCNNQNYKLVIGDARNKVLVEKLVNETDVIIPLAGIVGMPICDERPFDAESINRDAVIMINDLRRPDQKLIFPNTNSGYGTQTGDFYCTEETPLEPVSLYGRTKCAAEKALLESDKPAVTFRLATVFGTSPRMRKDLLVNNFTWIAMNSGSISLYEAHAVRNYIHIEDVARAFIHAIENFDSMKGQAYNVGLDDANLSKRQLADKIKEHFPNLEISENMKGTDPDKRNYIVSNAKIKNTGFLPKYSLDDGIKALIKSYKMIIKTDPHQNYA